MAVEIYPIYQAMALWQNTYAFLHITFCTTCLLEARCIVMLEPVWVFYLQIEELVLLQHFGQLGACML